MVWQPVLDVEDTATAVANSLGAKAYLEKHLCGADIAPRSTIYTIRRGAALVCPRSWYVMGASIACLMRSASGAGARLLRPPGLPDWPGLNRLCLGGLP
jgi:hypothetical protein